MVILTRTWWDIPWPLSWLKLSRHHSDFRVIHRLPTLCCSTSKGCISYFSLEHPPKKCMSNFSIQNHAFNDLHIGRPSSQFEARFVTYPFCMCQPSIKKFITVACLSVEVFNICGHYFSSFMIIIPHDTISTVYRCTYSSRYSA